MNFVLCRSSQTGWQCACLCSVMAKNLKGDCMAEHQHSLALPDSADVLLDGTQGYCRYQDDVALDLQGRLARSQAEQGAAATAAAVHTADLETRLRELQVQPSLSPRPSLH